MVADHRDEKHLVHRYFGIDVAEVWDMVARDMPDLQRMIEAILQALGEPAWRRGQSKSREAVAGREQ